MTNKYILYRHDSEDQMIQEQAVLFGRHLYSLQQSCSKDRQLIKGTL